MNGSLADDRWFPNLFIAIVIGVAAFATAAIIAVTAFPT